MNRKIAALALSGALLCASAAFTLPAGAVPAAGQESEAANMEAVQSLPNSVLYCGTIKEILTGAEGVVTGLRMDSEQSGEYIMKITDETVWIDSGERTSSSPVGLEAGERVHVFHSPVSTRSMPPQSAAFAVVRNIPHEVGAATYHKVEAVQVLEDRFQITTSSGGLYVYVNQETGLSTYTGAAMEKPEDIQAGDLIMAWYGPVALSYPGQTYAEHVMVLDQQAASEPLTRAGLIGLLYEAEGKPVVDYEMNYSDVDPSASYVQAIRWASSRQIISGYGDGRVGPLDAVSREQMAMILWRWAGSPILMDYPGLTGYSDAGDIAVFAQPALAWAHQKGALPDGGRLGPKDIVSLAEAERMIEVLNQ